MQSIKMHFQSDVRAGLKLTAITLSFMLLAGCGQLISNAKQSFANDLSDTILAYDDPETIEKAVPSYLLLVSSMIRGEPDNPDLLESGAKLYGAYSSAFVESENSRRVLSERAFRYASQSMCLRYAFFCEFQQLKFVGYKELLAQFAKDDASHLFVFASSWAGIIQADSGNWNNVAELPKVKASIQRVLELDETVDNGNAHLYMAVMETLLPPSMGGKPDLAKKHFERAKKLSHGKNLMVNVFYAQNYARLLFDRELHDRLLKEVLATDISDDAHDENRLMNVLAKQKAKVLLETADDYF